jgi:hypothetical protein
MTMLRFAQPWATDENYSSGPDTGTPTKVDPSSYLNGFIKATAAAPQHMNYLLNRITTWLSFAGPGYLMTWRKTNLSGIVNARMLSTYDLSTNAADRTYMGDTNAIQFVAPLTGLLSQSGTLASLRFKGVARNVITGGRIAGVFDSATPLAYSDNGGSTWTTVASANAFGGNNNAEDIGFGTIWGACVNGVTNAIYSSSTAASGSWTSRSLNGTAGDIPKRIVGSPVSGRAIVLGTNAANTAPFMAESANGTAWAAAAVPAGATSEVGDICYDPVRERFWWLAGTPTGFNLYYSSTSGSAAWTLAYSKVLGIDASRYSVAVDPLFGLIYLASSVGFVAMSHDDAATFFSQSCTINSVACVAGCVLGYDENAGEVYIGPTLKSHAVI